MWASSTPCKILIWSCQFKWTQKKGAITSEEHAYLRGKSTRMWIDYQVLNKAIRIDHFSLLFIGDKLEMAGQSLILPLPRQILWLSHTTIHEDNRSKTTFTCLYGTLRLSANVIWSLQRTCFTSEVYDGVFLRPNRENHERFLSPWQYLEMLV